MAIAVRGRMGIKPGVSCRSAWQVSGTTSRAWGVPKEERRICRRKQKWRYDLKQRWSVAGSEKCINSMAGRAEVVNRCEEGRTARRHSRWRQRR